MGRTIYIHVRVRTYSGATLLDNFITQIFFDDSINNVVLASAAYKRTSSRDMFNTNDMVYTGAANPRRMLMPVTTSGGLFAEYDFRWAPRLLR